MPNLLDSRTKLTTMLLDCISEDLLGLVCPKGKTLQCSKSERAVKIFLHYPVANLQGKKMEVRVGFKPRLYDL